MASVTRTTTKKMTTDVTYSFLVIRKICSRLLGCLIFIGRLKFSLLNNCMHVLSNIRNQTTGEVNNMHLHKYENSRIENNFYVCIFIKSHKIMLWQIFLALLSSIRKARADNYGISCDELKITGKKFLDRFMKQFAILQIAL